MATLAVVPHSTTLFEIETDLLALVESAETVTPEQEGEYTAALGATLQAAVEKRDRCHQFLCHLEAQALQAKTEIARLQERKRWFDAAAEKFSGYIVKVIEGLGTDAKGKHHKLEGKSVSLSIRANPASVEILDPEKVPAVYQHAHIRMQAVQWEALLDSLDLDMRTQIQDTAKVEYEPSKTLIKQALDAKQAVEGADLAIGKYRLERK